MNFIAKSKYKLFNNIKNYPLFESLPAEIPTLRIAPPPGLHIMKDQFNHIWKEIEQQFELNQQLSHEFALKNNCVRESYHGKTFEGNECAKLMDKIDSGEECCLSKLTDIECHIESIKQFNK